MTLTSKTEAFREESHALEFPAGTRLQGYSKGTECGSLLHPTHLFFADEILLLKVPTAATVIHISNSIAIGHFAGCS